MSDRLRSGQIPKNQGVGRLAKPTDTEIDQRLVDVISYSLIPNHEHMILEQLVEGGISEFMKRLGGYTSYFNNKYKRSGALFQGTFKSAHVAGQERLDYLIAYVCCNAQIHQIAKAEDWIWSSYLDIIGKRNGSLCNRDIVLKNYKSIDEFKNYCREVAREVVEARKELKNDLLEEL